MTPNTAIDIASPCVSWKRLYPDAERLARETALVALVEGSAATGITSLAQVELGITLTDDAHQRQLNQRYRGRDVSTNVLAFRAWEPRTHIPAGMPLLLGDVVLAFETVAREAHEQVKPFCDHVRHLIVHGVLHLLGCDHEREADAIIMERLETSILAKLWVPDPYHDINWSIEPESVEPESVEPESVLP
jgi:probable rRNA maturation factor